MVEVFKSTTLRRMTTGGNYINVSADVVLASDYASLEAELKAAREALTEARSFVDRHSEPWYTTGQELLKQIDAALSQPPVGERGWPHGSRFHIAHDGFHGTVIGHYERLDGKRGVVGQMDNTNIVHVYGEKWLPAYRRPLGDDEFSRG